VARAVCALDQAHHVAALIRIEHRDQEAPYRVAAIRLNLGKRTADACGLQRGKAQSQRFSLRGNV